MYKIVNLHGHPDDGLSLQLVPDIYLPYKIIKGGDGYQDPDKWYVIRIDLPAYLFIGLYTFSTPFDNKEEALFEAARAYKKWLEVSLDETHNYLLKLHNL